MTSNAQLEARLASCNTEFDRAKAVYEAFFGSERSVPREHLRPTAETLAQNDHPQKAANIYEFLGDLALAADLYETADFKFKAAELFEKTDQPERAISMHLKVRGFADAARIARANGLAEKEQEIYAAAEKYWRGQRSEATAQKYATLSSLPPDRQEEVLKYLGEVESEEQCMSCGSGMCGEEDLWGDNPEAEDW